MTMVIRITYILIISFWSLQLRVMAQSTQMDNGAGYKDKMTIDADYKKELLDLGFKDGKYPDIPHKETSYQPYSLINNIIYTSGVSAVRPDGTILKGRVPTDVSQEQLINASKLSCVRAIHHLKNAAGGDLSRIRKIANIRYLTLSEREYIDYAEVSNACSTMMVRVFGQTVGSHTRFAIGLVSSPMNETFKINVIAYLK